MTPEYSILIPTRDRPDTLRHTLETVVTQPGDDYEIVIADNAGGAETRAVIEAAAHRHKRLRVVRSDAVLPMSENWERGLAACQGRYVTVLGDDDGFLPRTMEKVRRILAASATHLLAWKLHTYWWPDTIIPWYANRLMVHFSPETSSEIDSKTLLRQFFAGEAGFGMLPMIYCAFFHRDIIERSKQKRGRFFWPPEMPADIVSGIAGLLATDTFVMSHHPLAVRGNSRKSTGTAHWSRSHGEARRTEYLAEEKKTWDQICHPSLIPSSHLEIIVASTKLRMREAFFPERTDLKVEPQIVVLKILETLNDDPSSYDANLADALKLAAKIGFSMRPEMIPARRAASRKATQGPFGDGRSIEGVCVNCDLVGITNVADAARMAEALSA